MNSLWFPFAFKLMIAWVACVSMVSAQVSFEREIKPIFEKHCYDCHGPDKQESGYRLDSRAIAMRGGDFGDAAIVPHDASKSPLYRFVSNRNDPLQMPPQDSGKESLSDKDLQTLKAWIDEGANWPDAFSGNVNRSSSHWSLQPLNLQNESDKSDNKEATIDGFIAEQLADRNLAPSRSADRQTLLRRLSFDLIGLPPTPEELDAFIQDESTSAYEKQVERLLASPHYGERWGRHWLDVARYTESQGFEYDRIRENAWHYRDYVIESFNKDKPYTQFMREQIAGDSIEPITKEGIVATSLLVCGPWDQAGNSQSNATQRAITREDELEDLIGVVGQSFLGLTINCARCHAHKFDPISHEDYYRIKSVFEGVKHGERDILSQEEIVARTNLRNEAQADMQRASSTLRELEKQGAQQYMSLNLDLAKQASLAPLSKWKFDLTAAQTPPGEQLGGAAITKLKSDESVLNLPSEGAFFRSPPIAESIREKTLEAWVSLANLDQRGGAAIAIETDDGRIFDAIVFGENQPRQWMAGSEGFARTVPLNDLEEDSPPGTFVHVAIVYAKDNSITFYRNGKPYGKTYTPAKPLQTFQAGKARILIGMRHTGGGRPWLTGQIKQAAIYDRALNSDEVLASYHANGYSPSMEQILSSFEPQQQRMYEEGAARQQPFLQGGTEDYNRLRSLMSGGPNASQQFLQMDPGYGFRLSEGMKALDRQAAARGGLMSGGALKAAQRYGQDYASNEFGNAYQRLAGLAQIGPSSAGVLNSLGQNYAGAAGQNLMAGGQAVGQGYMNAGNARASGYIGGANAISGGLGQYLNYRQNQDLLNRLLPPATGTPYTPGAYNPSFDYSGPAMPGMPGP